MKQLLITIAALVLVGCGESQQSTPAPEPPTVAPYISIHGAAYEGNIEAVKQHIAAGTDVNAVDDGGLTPLDWAVKVISSTRIKSVSDKISADKVKKAQLWRKQLDDSRKKTADLLRKHGGKTGEELKAEVK